MSNQPPAREAVPSIVRPKHLGVSRLHILTAKRLRANRETLVIHAHSQPIAALIPYDIFVKAQELLETEHD